jgi:hypothetical protein
VPKEPAPPVKPRSPLVRALLPNVGGIVILGLIAMMLWGFAGFISRDGTGARTIVLDHTGDDPALGWVVYFGYPADGDEDCIVEQIIGTRQFIDCDGNTLDVSELAPPPPGVNPVVENSRLLSIDLSGVTEN